MGDVVAFPQVRAKDGGKERIVSRRKRLGLNEPFRGDADDTLVMLRADNVEAPSDCV